MTPVAALGRGLEKLLLPLPPGSESSLMQYLALLDKWNKTYSLTAIRDPLQMIVRHLLDSLAPLPHLPFAADEEISVADVGSGAGLPGIPMAIARPAWKVTLNDSNSKKVAFLRQAVIELRMRNVHIHHERAERWRPPLAFQLVISRAFADLDLFISTCRHLVAPGGVLAAMRGSRPRVAPPGSDIIRLSVPFLDAERHLVLLGAGK